jgi:hypothetical protein
VSGGTARAQNYTLAKQLTQVIYVRLKRASKSVNDEAPRALMLSPELPYPLQAVEPSAPPHS